MISYVPGESLSQAEYVKNSSHSNCERADYSLKFSVPIENDKAT
jgi:hypothetical protein